MPPCYSCVPGSIGVTIEVIKSIIYSAIGIVLDSEQVFYFQQYKTGHNYAFVFFTSPVSSPLK